jgi:hypothetical protein
MILPTKHISTPQSILGAGSVVLEHLRFPCTATGLWDQVRELPEIGAYWRFILILDFLFAIGALELSDGLIVRHNA